MHLNLRAICCVKWGNGRLNQTWSCCFKHESSTAACLPRWHRQLIDHTLISDQITASRCANNPDLDPKKHTGSIRFHKTSCGHKFIWLQKCSGLGTNCSSGLGFIAGSCRHVSVPTSPPQKCLRVGVFLAIRAAVAGFKLQLRVANERTNSL